MSDSDRELLTMRMMAWARSKGELEAFLCTFWDDDDELKVMKYSKVSGMAKAFISDLEREGLF